MVDPRGGETIPEQAFVRAIREVFELTPRGMIEMLNLRRPIYRQTAAYGHFGRDDLDLPWERTDKAEIMRKEALGK